MDKRIQTLPLALLLATAALAAAPAAQAAGPVQCVHDVVNTSSCALAFPPPGTPVGAGLTCNYLGGEVGAEVHAGALSVPLCYAVDPAPASCGGSPGVGVVENGVSFDQCVDTTACPAPFVGQRTTSSINEASHIVCVDPASPCGGGGVEFFFQVGSGPIFVGCIPMAYVTAAPCAGFVGTEVTVGHPFTGDLVNVCL